MNNWKVIYYISNRDENPVKIFLDSNTRVKIKALRILSHIKEFGPNMAIPHIKKLAGTPLWEIRILGQDNARVIYATLKGQQILLLHGFIKKTNKTPRKEIEISISRLREFR